jgi:hypothetical protein
MTASRRQDHDNPRGTRPGSARMTARDPKPNPPTHGDADGRQATAAELKDRYEAGLSIRHLADETGRSHGTTRRILAGAGTTFRPRGVDRRPQPRRGTDKTRPGHDPAPLLHGRFRR